MSTVVAPARVVEDSAKSAQHSVASNQTQAASEFLRYSHEASVGSYSLNLANFPSAHDPQDLEQEAALRLVSANLIDEAGERLTRIVVRQTSISMARKCQARCRGYTSVFNECELPRNLSGDTPITTSSINSHEKAMDDQEELNLLKKRMNAALGVIKESEAMIIRMRFLDGKTVKQIAVELGTTRDTIDCRLRRGLKAVKEYREDIADGTSIEI